VCVRVCVCVLVLKGSLMHVSCLCKCVIAYCYTDYCNCAGCFHSCCSTQATLWTLLLYMQTHSRVNNYMHTAQAALQDYGCFCMAEDYCSTWHNTCRLKLLLLLYYYCSTWHNTCRFHIQWDTRGVREVSCFTRAQDLLMSALASATYMKEVVYSALHVCRLTGDTKHNSRIVG